MSFLTPHNAQFEPGGQGCVLAALQCEAVPVTAGSAIDVWRRHYGLDDQTDALCPAPCNAKVLHDPQVVAYLRALLNDCDPELTALIYVHRGYQPQYRTPLLQSLLSQLPELGAHFSHRCAEDLLPEEVGSLIASLLTTYRDVVVLWDRHDRLLPTHRSKASYPGAPLTRVLAFQTSADRSIWQRAVVDFLAPPADHAAPCAAHSNFSN